MTNEVEAFEAEELKDLLPADAVVKDLESFETNDIMDLDMASLFNDSPEGCSAIINELSIERLKELKKSLKISIENESENVEGTLNVIAYVDHLLSKERQNTSFQALKTREVAVIRQATRRDVQDMVRKIVEHSGLPQGKVATISYYVCSLLVRSEDDIIDLLTETSSLVNLCHLVHRFPEISIPCLVEMIVLEGQIRKYRTQLELCDAETESNRKSYKFYRIKDMIRECQNQLDSLRKMYFY